MRILVTGGAGYIGSHTCVELLQAGHDVVVFDNLCNSHRAVIARMVRIANRAPELVEGDVRDARTLAQLFAGRHFDAVLHFAGLKAVAESVEKPLEYYENNVQGTLVLCRAMAEAGVKTLVFSSSATVYDSAAPMPLREDAPLGPTNPYGHSKLMAERLLRDFAAAVRHMRIGVLRYFNPVGAHPSGLIGENPLGIPNNLMPNISQVAVGLRRNLRVFGSDYPTRDGTGVRDYLHVVDLARGHVAALEVLQRTEQGFTVNLGTGRGTTVLEAVAAFERASGLAIPLERVARRAGDVAQCYADPGLAERLLGWKAGLSVDAMCRDAWHWQRMNPRGYQEEAPA